MSRIYTTDDLRKIYAEHPLKKSTILARLQRQRENLEIVTELDLAVDAETEITDQNHPGGLAFVQQLACVTGITIDSLVLDAGSGLGGPARALAYFYGCRVHGVEITELRCRDAVSLTELVRLQHLVSFTCGDFLTADLPMRHFDVILAQGSFAHFHDRKRVLARCADLLKEGGRLALEDACLKNPPTSDQQKSQVAQAEDSWKCYLVCLERWISDLQSSAFRIVLNQDRTPTFIDYFSKLLRIAGKSPAGSLTENEMRGWQHAAALAGAGVLGYFRIAAKLDSG